MNVESFLSRLKNKNKCIKLIYPRSTHTYYEFEEIPKFELLQKIDNFYISYNTMGTIVIKIYIERGCSHE